LDDPHLLVLKNIVQRHGAKEVVISDDGVMQLQSQNFVPIVDVLSDLILKKAHNLRYSIQPGVTKLYRKLKQYYSWRRMKKDIVNYISLFLNC